MSASEWNPWSHFFMLDYFSRAYFAGVLFMALWGYRTFVRLIVAIRSRSRDAHNSPKLLPLVRKLCSIESFAMVLTSGCCANQIFAVWFTYMARATDANPFFALRQAWIVVQALTCLIVSLDAVRRVSFAMLDNARADSC